MKRNRRRRRRKRNIRIRNPGEKDLGVAHRHGVRDLLVGLQSGEGGEGLHPTHLPDEGGAHLTHQQRGEEVRQTHLQGEGERVPQDPRPGDEEVHPVHPRGGEGDRPQNHHLVEERVHLIHHRDEGTDLEARQRRHARRLVWI